MLPNIAKTNERIRDSESFPRIRDAEEFINNDNPIIRRKPQRRRLNTLNPNFEERGFQDPDNSFFRNFSINKDASVSKYMPFDDVVYPKLFSENSVPPESIENIWMAGFLDESHRERKKDLKNQLKMYSEMPNSIMYPHMESTLRSISQEEKRKHKNRLRSQRKSQSLTVVDSKINEMLNQPFDHKSSLTVDEQYKLKEFEHKLLIRKIPSKLEKLKPYEESNKRMRKARKPLKPIKQIFESNDLDAIFEFERRKHHAAIIIQRIWRRPKPIRKFQHAVTCMLMAVRIQKLVRGILARKYVAHYFRIRDKYLPLWQARMRTWLSNQHLKIIQTREKNASIAIQKIIRSKIAIERCKRLKLHVAAQRIQALWRGITTRARIDRQWLDRIVIPIQRCVRRMLAQKRCRRLKVELYGASIQIQSWYRSWYAFKSTAEHLFDRETAYRNDTLAILTAEEEFAEDRLIKLAERLAKRELRENLEMAARQLTLSYAEIETQENELLETKRQISVLPSEEIQHGTKVDMDRLAKQMRAALTEMKLKCIFEESVLVKRYETQLENRVEDMEQTARMCIRASHCREIEGNENLARQLYKSATEAEKKRRQAIGDEKRMWKIRFYTTNGKPDPRRRPGRRWDPSIIAGPEKATYSAGVNVDLTANSQSAYNKQAIYVTPQMAVDKALNQVTLQTYLQQVRQYETLLNPLFGVMEQRLGGAPGLPTPEKQGWGAEGRQLVTALRDIDAVPVAWPEVNPEARTTSSQSKRSQQPRKKSKLQLALASGKTSAISSSASKQIGNDQSPKNPPSVGQGSSAPSQIKSKKGKIRSDVEDSSTISSSSNLTQFMERRSPKSGERSLVPYSFEDNERLEEKRKQDAEHYAKRKQKKQERRRDPAVIPWALLDQLEGEKQKLQREKNYVDFHFKY